MPKFDKALACKLAQYSELSYENESTLKKKLKGKVIFFHKGSTQAFLHVAKEFSVLAFRGTEKNFQDILTDITFAKIDHRGGRKHRGFVKAFKRIERDLQQQNINGPLYITGHSLGGALAVLASEIIPCTAVYTFGAPRLLSWKTKIAQKPHYRLVNSNDIVPRLPPVLFNFRHSGTLVYLTKAGGVKKTDPHMPVITDLANTLYFLFPLLVHKSIDKSLYIDHKISEYVKKLKKRR